MSHTVTVTHGDTAESLRDTQRHTPLRAPLLAAHPNTSRPAGSGPRVHNHTARDTGTPGPPPRSPTQARTSTTAVSTQSGTQVTPSNPQPRRQPQAHTPQPAALRTSLPGPHRASHSQHPVLCTQPHEHAAPHRTAPTRGPGPHPSHTQESQAHNLSYPLVTRWLSQRQHAHMTARHHRDPVCPPSLWG